MSIRFGLGSFRHVFSEQSLERPLSSYLSSRVPIESLLRSIDSRRMVEEDPRELACELAQVVATEIVQPVRVVEWTRGGWEVGDDSNYRFGVDRSAPSSPHLWIAGKLEGDVDMLTRFPDSARSQGVVPLAGRPTPGVDNGYHQDAYWILPSQYRQSPFGDGEPFVWTEVILPRSVYDRLDGMSPEARPSNMLPRHFIDRMSVLLDETERTFEYWTSQLPDALLPYVEAARTAVKRDEAASEGIEFLPKWRPQRPTLVKQDADTPQPAGPTVALSTQRLSGSTYSDFLAVTRKWSEAITRSPRSFATLPEEDMSALLAATLNGSFPFAAQEVFSYTGKTDVYVRADRLDGTGPEKVFVLENHWWHGESLLHQKLDQLLGYCTVRDTHAVLMAMVHERDAMPDVKEALASHEAIRRHLDDVCGFPTFDVVSEPRHVKVALVVLDLRSI